MSPRTRTFLLVAAALLARPSLANNAAGMVASHRRLGDKPVVEVTVKMVLENLKEKDVGRSEKTAFEEALADSSNDLFDEDDIAGVEVNEWGGEKHRRLSARSRRLSDHDFTEVIWYLDPKKNDDFETETDYATAIRDELLRAADDGYFLGKVRHMSDASRPFAPPRVFCVAFFVR